MRCAKICARAPDIARALARLSVGRGGPRDLGALRDGIKAARALRESLSVLDDPLKPSPGEAAEARARARAKALRAPVALADMLERLLVEEPPFSRATAVSSQRARMRRWTTCAACATKAARVIASLEARYREASGVAALRIKHNGVLGYFIEVTPRNADKLLASAARDLFRHRQTIGSAVRFSTDELANLASRIAEAAEQALALERELFDEMTAEAMAASAALSDIAGALARLDVASALAELAIAER